MAFNSFDFKGKRYKQLKVFCGQVMGTQETPDLIRLVAGEAVYVNYCREIADAGEQYLEAFALFCRRCGFDPDEIRTRVCLAATALGVCRQVDYYRILGVSPDADDAAIKQAYRKKAQILHPDKRNGDKGNSDEFVELHLAYEHLSEPGLRKVYDESRQFIRYWTEGYKGAALPKRRSGAGRFISWLCVLAGGGLIAAYAFDVYRNQLSYLASPQTSENRLKESEAVYLAAFDEKAASEKILKPMCEKTAESSKTKAHFPKPLPVVKPASTAGDEGFAQVDQEVVSRATAADGAPHEAVTASMPKGKTIQRKARTVPKIAKAAVPKKVSRPGLDAAPADISTVSGVQKSHGSKIVATKKKMDDETVYLLQKQRVLSFLQNYTKTYEEKDLEQFRKFFTHNALEQGKPFITLLPKYRKIFDSVELLRYKIELKSLSMNKRAKKISVEGNFTARYRLPQKEWGSRSGSIRMELLDAPDGLLVSRMDYRYSRHKTP